MTRPSEPPQPVYTCPECGLAWWHLLDEVAHEIDTHPQLGHADHPDGPDDGSGNRATFPDTHNSNPEHPPRDGR